MTELIITRGLPGAGKTTRAETWIREDPENRCRVNRDVLREGVFGQPSGILSRKGETHVTALQRRMVREFLDLGRSVIIDDTNLSDPLVDYWRQLAVRYEIPFTVWDMRDVPRDVCIERDLNRAAAGGRYVTVEVIIRMDERQAASWQA